MIHLRQCIKFDHYSFISTDFIGRERRRSKLAGRAARTAYPFFLWSMPCFGNRHLFGGSNGVLPSGGRSRVNRGLRVLAPADHLAAVPETQLCLIRRSPVVRRIRS